MAFKVRFQVSVAATILLIIVALTSAMVGSLYVVSSQVARESAGQLFGAVARAVSARVDGRIDGTLALANLGAARGGMGPVRGDGLDAPVLPFILTALAENRSLYSLYYGRDDGSFLQVIPTRGNPQILPAHKAPPGTRWIVRTIFGEGPDRTQRWSFLDASRRLLGTAVEARPVFDPRQRPWYEAARGVDHATLSDAYLFNSLAEPGITASRRFDGGVFGVDVTLAGLDDFVRSQAVSKNGGVVIFDRSSRVLAVTESLAPGHKALVPLADIPQPMIKALVRVMGGDQKQEGLVFTKQGGVPLVLQRTEWRMAGLPSIGIAVMAPAADFTKQIRAMQERILTIGLVCLAIFLVVGLAFARGMSVTVRALADDALRIRNMDFSGEAPRTSRIIEFSDLGEAFHLMKKALSARTRALEDAQDKLTRLVDLGIAMSAERDSRRLMDMLLLEAMALTNADGGTVYTRGDDEKMHFQLLHNVTLGMALGGTSGDAVDIPPVPLLDDAGEPNRRNVVSQAVHRGETVVVDDAYDSSFDFSGPREFDARNGYRSRSFMTVPLKPRNGDVIGALQLINARAPGSNEPVPFPEGTRRFVEALSAQAATALLNHNLLAEQERLMDSMIQLIANAVDAKSPYTGGHCKRVPELAFILAEEAGRQTEGPFADFRFKNEEEWREFRIGAWLHDCGKVVTPEHVVDKATKLEAIYNRIHEVRLRYEVLLRDADIDRLEAVAAGEDPAVAQSRCDAEKVRLLADFAFIAECNIGSEVLAPEKVERLKEIAKTTWLRHIDDRLGLADAETKRFADTPAPPLPMVETVLADKPWHVIPRDEHVDQMYDGLGFKMQVPEHLYNQGEIYNLSISRGTLTAEDRFKINEHVMQTIAMLERMPFPKHLRRVPEYAGTHHEALDGTGYPRGLDAEQLSVPARIMAIADIFEALTAADRPYKPAKSLSEAVDLLHSFKKKGHIDPDLFDLFLTSGVHTRYGAKYLTPQQLDAVDIEKYLGAA